MPHINRIRVNNVKYNFGTQFYDDFVMRFSEQNTIYDLANGGGKSVLMLLLLQNLIPNCTLDEKQPIEKLFRSGNDNTVIHSLIEWKLNHCDIKDGFQYMTTGFCARKAKDTVQEGEEGRDTANIEYFNYCIFYKDFQGNDILNLPLSDGGERITFTGLRNYLRDIGKKDYNLKVQLFDRKGDYQRFISDYGLYGSEWEIIRGINRTEGHVRTYFETHYKTTRKVVEDLFIEEIIEKSFRNRMEREEEEDEIAKTLLDIRDKLVELAQKKGELSHYDRQMEALESFQTRLAGLEGIYGKKDELEGTFVRSYNTAREQSSLKNQQLEQLKEKHQTLLDSRAALTGKLDNARIMEEAAILEKLKQDTARVRSECETAEESCRQQEAALREKEGANDYYDYLEQKRQLEIQNNALYSISNEDALAEELYTLAWNRRRMIDGELEAMEKEEQELSEAQKQERQQLQQEDSKERHWENQTAVLKSREAELTQRSEELGGRLEEQRSLCGLFLLEKWQEELNETNKAKEQIEKQLLSCQQALQEKEHTFEKMVWEKEQIKPQLEQAQKVYDVTKQAEKEQKESWDKIARMEAVYERKGIEALLARILEAYGALSAAREDLLGEIEMVKECLSVSEKEMVVCLGEPARELMAYIQRHYDEAALWGKDYLMRRTEEDRKKLLEQMSYLPESIVVNSHFLDITLDNHIKQLDFKGYIVPVVEKKALEEQDGALKIEHMFFAQEVSEAFYDEKCRRHQRERYEKQLQEQEKKLARLEENAKVLEGDLAFLHSSMQLEEQTEELRTQHQTARKQLKQLNGAEEKLQGQMEKCQEQQKVLQEQIKTARQQLQELAQKQQALEETGQLYQAYSEAEQKMALCRREREEAERKMEEGLHNTAHLRKTIEEKEQILANIANRRQELEHIWSRFEHYYEEGSYPELDMDPEELDSLFEGKRLAFEQKHADISDKKRLAAAYERAMEKSMEAIRYKGLALEELAVMYEEHRLSQTPVEQLMREKSVLNRQQDRLENLRKELADWQTKMDRQEGSIRHGQKVYEEKYGEYHPLEQTKEGLPLLIKETTQQLEALKGQEQKQEELLRTTGQETIKLDSMIEEMERMMENFEMDAARHEGTLDAGEELLDTYKMVRRDYERLAREEQSRHEEFERDKAKLVDTLKLLEAYDLAQEVERSVRNPRNLQDVKMHMDNIRQTMDCILLEKEHISQGIENMEQIKDNFENRCLQTCSTIREALERLPNLSVITLEEKPVQMVSLQIPYVKEEVCKERMSHYIDEIAQQADSYASPKERLRFIRSRLAWKRLFSVVVRDMDKIRLQLYKRERMKEQSRYLKYEEAVGSTGQSQGIYIQFLIAVINYIASMNARNADAGVLKKVIFLDNPFGAAKDVYIWEPIFKLLAANHVQLIVPARGATPAIIGRFAVNYVLGQKLIDGRQQTVVVDYRSEVRSSQLEYRELEFEQGRLELE